MCCCIEYSKPVDGGMKLFPKPCLLYHEISSFAQLHINELQGWELCSSHHQLW